MNFEKELKDALQEYETSLVEHYEKNSAPERRRVMKRWNPWKIATVSLAAALVLFIGWQSIGMLGAKSSPAQDRVSDAYLSETPMSMNEESKTMDRMESSEKRDGSSAEGNPQGNAVPRINPEEKIIRYFTVNLETKNLLESTNKLEATVKELGGYIESSNRSGKIQEDSYASAYYTLRIPKAKEADVKLALEGLGEILDIAQQNENVTQYYRDTESRVAFLKAKEDKLMEFMDKAETLEDILNLESKIMDLQFERENLTGTLKNLDNRVDYDTYQISLRQVLAYTEVSFGRKLKESFILSLDKFVNFVQGLAFFVVESWIFLLILVIFILSGIRIFKKKRTKPIRKDEVEKKEEE